MIQIQSSEHVFMCGMTGTGKTTLMKRLYRGIKGGHAIVVDVKNELTMPGAIITSNPQKIPGILDNGHNVVFRMRAEKTTLDLLARYAYARGNVALIVDEAALTLPEGQLPAGSKELSTSGRSRRAVFWVLCQRPANVDKTIISQCNHYFIFPLIQDQDKKAIAANIPLSIEKMESTPLYRFYYYRAPPLVFGAEPVLM